MANNTDLDDFFKKKDRKGQKNKKQTGILSNNEELLKQLVIVTTATTAFKENIEFDEEEEEELTFNPPVRTQVFNETNGSNAVEDISQTVIEKSEPYSASINNKPKQSVKLGVRDNNNINEQETGAGQQDEWEEYEQSNSKYEQLYSKFSRAANEHNNWSENDDDDGFDNEYNSNTNNYDHTNDEAGGDEQPSRGNRRQEQKKDKPAWNLDQIKSTEAKTTEDQPKEKIDEPSVPKPQTTTTTGVYKPPHSRGNSAVTVVSGASQRTTKKDKPNLASTEEFPTLGAITNKK